MYDISPIEHVFLREIVRRNMNALPTPAFVRLHPVQSKPATLAIMRSLKERYFISHHGQPDLWWIATRGRAAVWQVGDAPLGSLDDGLTSAADDVLDAQRRLEEAETEYELARMLLASAEAHVQRRVKAAYWPNDTPGFRVSDLLAWREARQ